MAKVNLAALASTDVPDSDPRTARTAGATELPVDRLAVNPLNQRADSDEDADELEAMAETIRAHGVLQPLIVVTTSAFVASYPDQASALDDARWVTLIGNRRLVAARRAQLRQVPAIVNDGQLGSMYEVMLVENGNRRELSPLREAEAIARALEHEGVTKDALAKRIGRTGAHVTYRLQLLGLIPALRAALDAKTLTVEQGREIGRLTDEEQEQIAATGPPYRTAPRSLNAVKRRSRGLPKGDPAAAAASIRELYSGDDLAELIRLLQAN